MHRKRGGQVGNGNAKKTLAWVESYDLTSPEGVRNFLWRKCLVGFDHGMIPIPIYTHLPISLFGISIDIQW